MTTKNTEPSKWTADDWAKLDQAAAKHTATVLGIVASANEQAAQKLISLLREQTQDIAKMQRG